MVLLLATCIAALAVLILGAEMLTRGAVTLARLLGIPPIVVGLTIVALGTSAPELAIGIDAAIKGQGDLAVANIAGTNMVNILLILGLSAALRPLSLKSQTIRMDLPAMIVAAALLVALALDGRLSRLDGAVLFAAGLLYTILVLHAARSESRKVRAAFQKEYPAPDSADRQGGSTLFSAVHLVTGIALVVVAADWLVFGAAGLARMWGVSDAFIGLTVIAIGTSAPELVTTVLSTLRGNRDVAIGNLLGSSIYNICIILGLTCLFPVGGVVVSPALTLWDLPLVLLVALVCLPVFWTGRQVSRGEGVAFVGCYLAYLTALLILRT